MLIRYYWTQNSSGNWGFHDSYGNAYTGNEYHMVEATEGLTKLMTGGQTGYDLVSFLAGHENSMQLVVGAKSMVSLDNKQVSWNGSGTSRTRDESVPTTAGMHSESFITLGHELAHMRYNWEGNNEKKWITVYDKSANLSEIYTTHIENKLRSENGLPLRTHYFKDINNTAVGPPIINTRLGTSRYYNVNENTNYRPLGKRDIPYKY